MLFSECFTRLASLNPHKTTRLCLGSILQESDFEMGRYVQEVYGGRDPQLWGVKAMGLGQREGLQS